MPTIQAIPVEQQSNEFAPNQMNNVLTFNTDSNVLAYTNTASGSGVTGADIQRMYFGDRSLVVSTSNNNADYEMNFGTNATWTTPISGRGFFCFAAMLPVDSPNTGLVFYLKIARNGVANWMQVNVNAEQFQQKGIWQKFFVVFTGLLGNQEFDLSIGIPANATPNVYFNLDGLAFYADDRNLELPPPYNPPFKGLPSATELANGVYRLKVEPQKQSWEAITP